MDLDFLGRTRWPHEEQQAAQGYRAAAAEPAPPQPKALVVASSFNSNESKKMTSKTRPAALIVALSMNDRIEFTSSNWLCVSKGQLGYNLVNETDRNVHLLLSVEDLHVALVRRKAKIHWDYHSAGKEKLRERIGGDLREGFTEHEVMIASFKEQIIIAYEKRSQKHGKLTAQEVEASLPEWAAKANKHINTPARVKFAKGRVLTYSTPSLRTFRRDYQTYVECGRDCRALLPLTCKAPRTHAISDAKPSAA
jgi:hypothetical protein